MNEIGLWLSVKKYQRHEICYFLLLGNISELVFLFCCRNGWRATKDKSKRKKASFGSRRRKATGKMKHTFDRRREASIDRLRLLIETHATPPLIHLKAVLFSFSFKISVDFTTLFVAWTRRCVPGDVVSTVIYFAQCQRQNGFFAKLAHRDDGWGWS